MRLHVERVTDDAEWDDLVEASASGTLFHSSLWTASSPFSFLRIGCRLAGNLIGGLVLQVNDTMGCLGTLAPYLGPIILEMHPKMCSALQYNVQNELADASQLYVSRPTFFTSPWGGNLQPFITAGFEAKLLYTSVVDISDLSMAEDRHADNLRRNMLAAIKDGLTVEHSDNCDELLCLVSKTFERQNQEIWFNLEECETVVSALIRKKRAAVFLARNAEGKAVAGVGIVWDKRRSYYILGGYDHADAHRGATSLNLWEAMRFTALTLRLTEFDLEGSYVPAIARFFRQFGGAWLPFYYMKQSSRPLIDLEE